MPEVTIPVNELKSWGTEWLGNINTSTQKAKKSNEFDRQQSVNFASFIDLQFGKALAVMLGGIPVDTQVNSNSLHSTENDSVEVGPVRVIGGIRPQNFDVAYRPDGPRIVFDSKSLNKRASIKKNWQNMINDLGTEATTVHTRFPYAIVSFMVILPKPALDAKQEHDIIRTLERLGTRYNVIDQPHLAESISLVIWNPQTGTVDQNVPPQDSNLRVERMNERIYEIYRLRYKGLPPHDV
ncbi:hypothetical protein CEQ90_20250 [Lewinellaceae bacterium SD302]|nr:hypothetical protein CEQ90_20250 [Lewinellaceae bacterium SD302]